MNLKRDFKLLRMWPRRVFQMKENAELTIKREVQELQRPGVYVLYVADQVYYVGRANRLFSRLHDHSNKMTDRYYAHWDHFSAFVLTEKAKDHQTTMKILEAALIAATPRSVNRSTPKFHTVHIPKVIRRKLGEVLNDRSVT